MITVTPTGNRYTWAIIACCGRPMVHAPETYASDFEANDAAKAWRARFWAVAAMVDHRQGAAI